MFPKNDPKMARNIAAVAEDLIRQGRTSEAIDVVYAALVKMGYPYRAMAEVAVNKWVARQTTEAEDGPCSTAEDA